MNSFQIRYIVQVPILIYLHSSSPKLLHQLLQLGLTIRPELSNLLNILDGKVGHVLLLSLTRSNGLRGHVEAHVLGSVDELENSRGGLVGLQRLYPQNSGVSSGSLLVALREGSEQLGEVVMGSLSFASAPIHRFLSAPPRLSPP